jgi:hypothetical protein
VCVKACKSSPGLVFRWCLAGWLAGCPLQLLQSRFVTPAAGVKPRSRGICCLFSHPFSLTHRTLQVETITERKYMCTFVTMPLSYVVAVTKKKNHWWGHRPSNICPCGSIVCPTGPKLGSKLILSLSLCDAIPNQ